MAGDKSLFRYAFEREEGVPGSSFHYARFSGETFLMDRPYEADPNFDPSGQETEGDNLRAEATGTLTAAPNTESLLPMRVHHQEWYEQSSPGAGVHDYALRQYDELTDDPLDFYVGSLNFGVWRDERVGPTEYSGFGLKVNEFTLSVDANKHVQFEHAGLYLRDSVMRSPIEQAVDAAWLGEWVRRGHRRRDDENGDYYKFKVSTAGGLGVAKIQWGKGAEAYGVTEYLVVDAWMDVFNADGTIAGTRREPFQIRPIFDGVLTLGDEWRIYPTAPKPVPVYSPRPKLTGTDLELRFSLDGGTTWKTKTIESFSLKMGVPREAKPGLGSVYMQEIGKPDNSKRWWEASFSRTYIDRDFEQARVSQRVISAYAKFYGGPIGATGFEDFAEYELEKTHLSQAGSTVTNAGDNDETVTLRAFSVNSSPLCKEKYRTTIADIHPVAA